VVADIGAGNARALLSRETLLVGQTYRLTLARGATVSVTAVAY